jgi:hypothetical protein
VSAPLGNPQVPSDPLRNYVFGPYRPAPTGDGNVGVGEVVLYSLRGGARNTAFGDQVLLEQLDGADNTAVGALALFGSQAAVDTTAIGSASLQQATQGESATAVGRLALHSTRHSQRDTALGDSALRFLATGADNVAIGYRCAEGMLAANGTVAVGTLGALASQTLTNCVLLGFETVAYAGNNACGDVVAAGDHALAYSSASTTVAVGAFAGLGIVSGIGNVVVGAGAAVSYDQRSDPDNSIAIGLDTYTVGPSELAIGSAAHLEVSLAGVDFEQADLMTLLRFANPRPRTTTRRIDSSFWRDRLKNFTLRAQDAHAKPPVAAPAQPVSRDRRLCLTAFLAGAVSACGGGSEPERVSASPEAAAGEPRASRTAVTGVRSASAGAASLDDLPLGNPLVAPDPLRNYVFGPNRMQPLSDTAVANVGVGEGVLRGITTGWANTAVGDNAMGRQQSGINCVAIGSVAMFNATQTIDCTALGAGALQAAIDGVGATAVGRLACASLASANNNTGIGAQAMRLTVDGIGNTAVGYKAMEANVGGTGNVVLGAHAARRMGGGDRNVVAGFYAMSDSALSSSDNVAVGANALLQVSGSRNTALGSGAGQALTAGEGNVFIGHQAGADSRQDPLAVNSVAIGAGTYTTASHQIVIGNEQTQTVILAGVTFTRSQLAALAALAAKARR